MVSELLAELLVTLDDSATDNAPSCWHRPRAGALLRAALVRVGHPQAGELHGGGQGGAHRGAVGLGQDGAAEVSAACTCAGCSATCLLAQHVSVHGL